MNLLPKLKNILPEFLVEQQFLKEFENIHSLEIISMIGAGSFGTVHLVQNKSTSDYFVLKRLRKRKWKSKAALAAFFQEQRILQNVSHPSFPAYITSGEILGIPYFIMEKKHGKTVEELLFNETECYTETESFYMAAKLLEIIVFMHDSGFVHRDIRIPNVLIDDDKVSLIDFGLAEIIESQPIQEDVHPKTYKNYLSDLYCLGHFLLYLLYSSYESPNSSIGSWEQELNIDHRSKLIIKRLLLVSNAYPSSKDAMDDIKNHYQTLRRDIHGTI